MGLGAGVEQEWNRSRSGAEAEGGSKCCCVSRSPREESSRVYFIKPVHLIIIYSEM